MNNASIFIMVLGAIVLVLWLISLIRILILKNRIRRKNGYIWRQKIDIQDLHARIREESAARPRAEEALEAAYAANDALAGKPVAEGTVSAPRISPIEKLDEAMERSHAYLRSSLSESDLTMMTCLEEREIYKALGDRSFGEYVNKWRLDYAISTMRESDGRTSESIAADCGFLSLSAMDKTCRKILGMDIEELEDVIKS